MYFFKKIKNSFSEKLGNNARYKSTHVSLRARLYIEISGENLIYLKFEFS